MHLYEVTNEYTGYSAVRCYVWTTDEATALQVARIKFEEQGRRQRQLPAYWERLEARHLMSIGDLPFCTEVDDSGWVGSE